MHTLRNASPPKINTTPPSAYSIFTYNPNRKNDWNLLSVTITQQCSLCSTPAPPLTSICSIFIDRPNRKNGWNLLSSTIMQQCIPQPRHSQVHIEYLHSLT
jgi:hypothetical protein